MSDPIDEILEDVRCPGGNDCDCPYFYCVGFIHAAVEAGIKKGALDCNDRWLADTTVREAAKKDARRKLARELLRDVEEKWDLKCGFDRQHFETKLREIAEEGDEAEHYERSMEEFEFDERSREEGGA